MHWKVFLGYTEYFSKRRCKIFICSFILKELEVFRVKGTVIFAIPENFRSNCTFYESENFSHNHVFESENFRFPFLRKLAKQIAEKNVRLPLPPNWMINITAQNTPRRYKQYSKYKRKHAWTNRKLIETDLVLQLWFLETCKPQFFKVHFLFFCNVWYNA